VSTPSFDPQPCCGDVGATADLIVSDTVCATVDGVTSEVIRQVLFDPNGVLISTTFVGSNGSVVVPSVWTPGDCTSADEFTTTGLCLGDGTPIGIINRRTDAGTLVQDGWVNLLTGAFSVGAPPLGTTACGQAFNVQQSDVLCDITTGDGVVHGLVLIQYQYAPDGTVMSTDVINATTGAPYTPVGTITVCPTDTSVPDNDMQVLCDRQTDGTLIPLVRDYRRDVNGIIIGFSDYTLSGAPYTPTGTVQSCIPRVSESEILCDSTGTQFLRTYTYTPSGSVSSFFDTTLAGGAFTPTGVVGNCTLSTTTTDVTVNATADAVVLCDSSAVPVKFLRTYHFDADGILTGFTDSTLAGGAFTPTGAVGLCSEQVTLTGGSTTASSTLTAVTSVSNGTTVDFGSARTDVSLFVMPNGTVTSGLVALQASQDGTNWVTIATSAMLTTGVNQSLSLTGGAYRWFRGTVTEAVVGGGTVTATLMFG